MKTCALSALSKFSQDLVHISYKIKNYTSENVFEACDMSYCSCGSYMNLARLNVINIPISICSEEASSSLLYLK
jgi:hypothetical protein